MTWFWTWDWFPANLCVAIMSVIVLLCGIWLNIKLFKLIIDEIFG